MLNKQLRLDVAQLTDVGRRREHNEDNMAYVIPKDPQVMALKGALFIVADGMGGHAAGEVASEIAVDTISTVFYQDDHDDIAVSLLNAIKRANGLIHQRAAENMLRSGMGTTCVAGVLRGNMAYVANVGDSRAYLIRKGMVKQISQDHSWVAEQVRAGLLTEEQARTHAQRNVITRSLGTQAEVEVDVFAEPLEDGDYLLLCSDGLSGLVGDDEMRSIVERYPPQESVYHLIERANENGGPDNITAIVIAVQEVGVEPPGARHPVVAGRITSSDSSEDTAILNLPPYTPASPSPVFGENLAPAGFGRLPSGPLPPANGVIPPQTAAPAKRKQRSRLLYVVLTVCILVVLALAGGGAYLYFTQSGGNNSYNHQITSAQNLIKVAQGQTVNAPATALHDLASAQTQLLALEKNSSLTSQQHTRVVTILQGLFTQSVKNAITSYNQQQGLLSLDCLNVSSNAVGVGSTSTQPRTLALAQVNGKPALYALGGDNKLYEVNATNNSLIPQRSSLPANATIQSVTGYNGTQLALLITQPGKSAIPNYSLDILSLPANTVSSSMSISLKNGQAPELVTAWGQAIYIVLSTPSSTQITVEKLTPGKNHQFQMTPATISASLPVTSVAAFPNDQLFLIQQDGTVQSWQFGSNQGPTSVFVDQPVPQPLAVSAHDFTWQTPVPTVTPAGSKTLAILNATANALVSGTISGTPHLYIMDTNFHRVLNLTLAGAAGGTGTPVVTATSTSKSGNVGGGTSPGNNAESSLHLQQQFTSPSLFAQMKSMVVDQQSSNLYVLAQSATSSLNLVSFSATSKTQGNCA